MKIPVLKIRNKDGNFIPINAIRGDRGKSAYEQAKEGGYTGTEEEFIAILNGLVGSEVASHYSDFDNPHKVTAEQLGLDNIKVGKAGESFQGIQIGSEAETLGQGTAIGWDAYSKDGAIAIGTSAWGKGGVAIGFYAAADGGVAIGSSAEANAEGSVAIGRGAKTDEEGGVAIGKDTEATYDAVAIGRGAIADSGGGAIGKDAEALYGGGAVGEGAYAPDGGGAIGSGAIAGSGGAVGEGAITGQGCAIGKYAKTVIGDDVYIDAIQLGTGTNPNRHTLQVYDYQLMDAAGAIPVERLPKPSGSYEGDYDIPAREFQIGGEGDVLLITSSSNDVTFVTSYGARVFASTSSSALSFGTSIAKFEDGVLTFGNCTQVGLNRKDVTYYYQVL